MAWSDDYRMSTVAYGANQIEAISQSDMNLNPEVRKTRAVRGTDAKVASLERISPTGSFTTFNLKQAFDAIPVAGVCADAGGDDIIVHAELRDCIGVQANKAIKYTIEAGVIAPQTLSVDHRGDATMSYSINAAFDGTNAPVQIEHDQANPTLTAGSDVKYTMDKFIIVDTQTAGDVAVEGKINMTLDFGARVEGKGADSTVADTVQTLDETFQVLSVRGLQLRWYRDNAGADPEDTAPSVIDHIAAGKVLTGAEYIRFYLKDRNELSTAAKHIEITVRGVVVGDTIYSGGPDGPAEASFQMHLVNDGTNAPVIVNPVLVAIP